MEDKMNQVQENLIQVILANTSSAMNISKILCDHRHPEQDKVLKADEVICGLVYRLMIPMTDEEITQSMNEAEELMQGESSDEEQDGGSDQEIIDDLDEFTKEKRVRTNTCNCNICSQVRVCLLNFNGYIPKDVLGDKFKLSILETCEKYNRTI